MIKVDYNLSSFSEEVMLDGGIHYVEGGHSIVVAPILHANSITIQIPY